MSDPNQPTHVTVTVYCARDLYSTNLIAKMDPYCIVSMGTHVFKTNVDDHGGKTPHWNQTFRMDYAGESHIRFKVMDKDKLSKDDYVGMADVTLSPIVYGTRVYNSEIELTRKEGRHAGFLKVTIEMEPRNKPSSNEPNASSSSSSQGVGTNTTAVPSACIQPQTQAVPAVMAPASYPGGGYASAVPPAGYAPGAAPSTTPYYIPPTGYVPAGYAAPPAAQAVYTAPVVGYAAAPAPVAGYVPVAAPPAGYAPTATAPVPVYGAVPAAPGAYPPATYGQPQPYYPPPSGGAGYPPR